MCDFQSTAQSQPIPLHEKSNKHSTPSAESNKVHIKSGRISDECRSPDFDEDSNKYSFNVTYVPSSSVTMDTEDVINLDHNNIYVLSWDTETDIGN